MKKNRFLFLMAFALFVLLPVNVFASEEFTKYEIIVDDPVVGELPSNTAKVIYSNKSTSVEYDVNLIWYIVNEDITYTELGSTEKIKDDTRYAFDLTTDDYNKITEDFEDKDYSKSQDLEVYINNYKIYYPSDEPRKDQNYYVGGLLEDHTYIETPIAGETPCKTAKVIFKTKDKSYEFTLKVDWEEYDDGFVETIASIFEVGKKYVFSSLIEEETFISGTIEDFENLQNKVDFRTKHFINDEKITLENEFVYGPLEDNVRVTLKLTNLTSSNKANEIARGSEYKTILTVDANYVLPETINIKVGDNVLDSTKYTYDVNTGTLIIPSEYVTGSINIEAEGLLKTTSNNEQPNPQPDEENPKTLDSLTNSILIGTISLVGLIGATVYLKRRNKVRV